MKQEITYSLSELPSVAEFLKKRLNKGAVIALMGPLGAGKTTFIQELLKKMGVKGRITSPTFTYMNHYISESGENIYHFDLYKIKDKEQFMDAGFYEYLYQPDGLVLIEWPEVIQSLLRQDVYYLTFAYHEDPQKRELLIEQKGSGHD